MDPKEWGRGFWMLIWIVLYDEITFPNLNEVKHIIDVITRNLPCDVCKEHFAKRIQDRNIFSTYDRVSLKKFFAEVYNTTNTSKNIISLDSLL